MLPGSESGQDEEQRVVSAFINIKYPLMDYFVYSVEKSKVQTYLK